MRKMSLALAIASMFASSAFVRSDVVISTQSEPDPPKEKVKADKGKKWTKNPLHTARKIRRNATRRNA